MGVLSLAACVLQLAFLPHTGAAQSPPPAESIDLSAKRLQVTPVSTVWRFHLGDDPAWAQPGFDDSNWQVIHPRESWPEQGYPTNAELGWLRFSIVAAPHTASLVIQVPSIDQNYQLFADGRLIGQVGQLPPQSARTVEGAPRLFTLPVNAGDSPRTVTIALRVWQERSLAGISPGILYKGMYVGDPAVQQSFFSMGKATYLLSHGSDYSIDLIALVVGAATMVLFWLTRERFYLALGIFCVLQSLNLVVLLAGHHFAFPYYFDVGLYIVIDFAGASALVFFIFDALNVVRPRTIVPTVGMFFLAELGPVLLLSWGIPILLADTIYFLFSTAGYVLPAFYLVKTWRAGNRDARLLCFPFFITAIISALGNLGHVLVDLNVPHGDAIITGDVLILKEPFAISLGDVGTCCALLGLLAVLINRFARNTREQQRLSAALKAAHDIQQRLVPVDIPTLGGLHTEISYRAAEEVGGDFCQILPRPDGSIFVAIGDVSGKGLQAAMLGAVAVGALRSMADEQIEPAAALERLNHVLLRTENSGFITCMCLVLTAEGEIIVANAGHLAPYLDGVEIPLEAGLPLGILPGVDYGQAAFMLPSTARLTLLSDGVVEARSSTGELFGFDRTSQVSQLSASEIAAKAHLFGQEDDITVITLDWQTEVFAAA
jgi:phosphoserine phosphatase RsbU/P